MPSEYTLSMLGHGGMGSNYDSNITVINKNSEILSKLSGSIYYNSDSNLFMGYIIKNGIV